MLEKTTPEKVGISSKNIKKFISVLEKNHLSTHAVLMMRHGKVFYENYRYPFNADYLHRVYSVSKSFVSLAIGFLADDGIIDIDAPMVNYLPSYAAETDNENIKKQTIRDMLMMSTGAPQENSYWFSYKPQDRLKEYFNASRKERGGTSKLPGTLFDYDSPGSFVLCCIAEILSGKNIIDYCNRIFKRSILSFLPRRSFVGRLRNFMQSFGSRPGRAVSSPGRNVERKAAFKQKICERSNFKSYKFKRNRLSHSM